MRRNAPYERLIVRGTTVVREQYVCGKWIMYGMWTKSTNAKALAFALKWS